MKFLQLFDIRNIIVLLFFVLGSYICGVWSGYIWGTENVNSWQVVSAYNAGYTTGHVNGGARTLYLIFEDYIKENHPYHWEMPDQKEQKNQEKQ